VGLRPAQGDENNFCSATTLNGSAVLPFVISTGAPKERSGEICGPAVLSWECFSTERSVVERSAVSAVLSGKCFLGGDGAASSLRVNAIS
jgi:hypothetical protein